MQCWDAAFILAEHLIAHSDEWNSKCSNETTTSLVELGSGSGLCGLMIAKAVKCHARITDLPELLPLMTRNVSRNFDTNYIVDDAVKEFLPASNDESVLSSESSDFTRELFFSNDSANDANEAKTLHNAKQSCGTVSASVLRWGVTDDYRQQYDVVLGADVVASLYDPIALAETMHALCHEESIVYVSYKGRLTGPHEEFEKRLGQLFENVGRIRPESRNKNPQVWILKAIGKR